MHVIACNKIQSTVTKKPLFCDKQINSAISSKDYLIHVCKKKFVQDAKNGGGAKEKVKLADGEKLRYLQSYLHTATSTLHLNKCKRQGCHISRQTGDDISCTATARASLKGGRATRVTRSRALEPKTAMKKRSFKRIQRPRTLHNRNPEKAGKLKGA